MHISSFLPVIALALAQIIAAAPMPDVDTAVDTVDTADTADAAARTDGLLVRKEWYVSTFSLLPFDTPVPTLTLDYRRALTKKQQLAYITAFKCLQSKPSRFSSIYPGALTRYDDYQAIHIAMTEKIHFTVYYVHVTQ